MRAHIKKGVEMINGFKYSRRVVGTYIRLRNMTEFGLIFPERSNLTVTFSGGEIVVDYLVDVSRVNILKPVEVPEELIAKLENLAKAKKELESESEFLRNTIAL